MNLKRHNFIFLTIAGIINSLGVCLLLSPVKLFDSGISGTAFLFNQITPIYLTLSFFLIVLNVPFFLLGLKKMGKEFVIYSLYAIFVYSFGALIINNVLQMESISSSPIVGTDKLLGALFGGLLSGIGSGMVIRYGGAIDGVEVMAVLFSKKLGLTVGTFVMIYNVFLYSVSALIFNSWEIPLYSIIAYSIGIKAVDFMVEGLDKAKAAIIITDEGEKVAAALSDVMGRGITILNAKGYYLQTEKTMIYCVLNRFEISKLKAVVLQEDENAFVTISDISDIIGNKITRKKRI